MGVPRFGPDAENRFLHGVLALATEVDFRLDRCPSEEGKLNLIASDDTLEIQLRRLASKVHEMRTGDKDAALHMLAISLPGSGFRSFLLLVVVV